MDSKLEKRIEKIEARNSKVTSDKAWEVSKTRRGIIYLAIYLIVGSYLAILNVSDPWLSALVPPTAFLVSTLALQKIKKIWIDKHNKQ